MSYRPVHICRKCNDPIDVGLICMPCHDVIVASSKFKIVGIKVGRYSSNEMNLSERRKNDISKV